DARHADLERGDGRGEQHEEDHDRSHGPPEPWPWRRRLVRGNAGVVRRRGDLGRRDGRLGGCQGGHVVSRPRKRFVGPRNNRKPAAPANSVVVRSNSGPFECGSGIGNLATVSAAEIVFDFLTVEVDAFVVESDTAGGIAPGVRTDPELGEKGAVEKVVGIVVDVVGTVALAKQCSIGPIAFIPAPSGAYGPGSLLLTSIASLWVQFDLTMSSAPASASS